VEAAVDVELASLGGKFVSYEKSAAGAKLAPRVFAAAPQQEVADTGPKSTAAASPPPPAASLGPAPATLEQTAPALAERHAAGGITPRPAVNKGPVVSSRVATFYYPWYGTPAVDGKWAHWDHPQIEHWNEQQRERFPHGESTRRKPPDSVGSNFFPASGTLYSITHRCR
jgi:hypothetical protein